MKIFITDPALDSAVAGWAELDGLLDKDCTVTDDVSENRFLPDTKALVVLYSSDGYMSSTVHFARDAALGARYSALKLPLGLGELSSSVRAVTSAKAETDGIHPVKNAPQSFPEKPEPLLSKSARTVSYLGKVVLLSRREYDLFEYLFENRQKTVSRRELCEKVWNGDVTCDTNAVDVYITYLRRKTEPLFGKGAIVSVRGIGYMLNV